MTQKLQTLPELKKRLQNRKSLNGVSWSDIAKELYPDENPKVWRSILWRIAKVDYEPKNNRLRKRLGLPFIKIVTACPDCNEIHLSGCPDAELPTRGKTTVVPVCEECGEVHVKGHPKKRKRQPRIAISLTNPRSAATTILKHMESNNISMLIELLNERRG